MKNSKIPSLFSVDSKILARRKNRLFFDRVALDVETFNFPIYTKIDESHILCTIEKLFSAMCILRSPRFNSVFILFSVFDDRKLRHPISYTNPPPLSALCTASNRFIILYLSASLLTSPFLQRNLVETKEKLLL